MSHKILFARDNKENQVLTTRIGIDQGIAEGR